MKLKFNPSLSIRPLQLEKELGRYQDSIGIREVTQHIYCSRQILNGCTTHMDSGKVHPK